MIFPLVYGKASKSNDLAVDLYELFRNLIEDEGLLSQYMVIDTGERERILKRLAKTHKSNNNKTGSNSNDNETGIYLKFMCEYGCALVLAK